MRLPMMVVYINSPFFSPLEKGSCECHTNVIHCHMFIFDSSTLILLAKADLLDHLLDDYPSTIAVPEAVEHECLVPPLRPDGILIRERIRAGHIVVDHLQDTATEDRLIEDFNLGMALVHKSP